MNQQIIRQNKKDKKYIKGIGSFAVRLYDTANNILDRIESFFINTLIIKSLFDLKNRKMIYSV